MLQPAQPVEGRKSRTDRFGQRFVRSVWGAKRLKSFLELLPTLLPLLLSLLLQYFLVTIAGTYGTAGGAAAVASAALSILHKWFTENTLCW